VRDCKIDPFFSSPRSLGAMMVKKKVFCAKLCHFMSHFWHYIQKQYLNQAFCKKESCLFLSLSLSLCACLACEWHTEMKSQYKLDPFSCIVVHGPKKRPTSLLWKGATSKGKIEGQKLFCQSNQGSGESLVMRKKLGV